MQDGVQRKKSQMNNNCNTCNNNCTACEQQTERVQFTKEMKKDYTILIPTMLTRHFKMITKLMGVYGYNVELLENSSQEVIDSGLKYVHNDTCYPALLVIGQFINAIESGKYDPHKLALLFTQTGGGCRASNYIPLLRKALAKAGYSYIPVISLNFVGMEKNPGFKLTLPMLRRMMYAVTYGDMLMLLINQTKPYEIEPGAAEALANEWTEKLANQLGKTKKLKYKLITDTYREIVRSFAALPMKKEKKVKVGIVGEIFVKFSPLGNNDLENFLISEGAETTMGGLVDFAMFYVCNEIADNKLYGTKKILSKVFKIAYKLLLKKQQDMIDAVREESDFRPFTSFEHTKSLIDGYIGIGAKMGEGWLLTAEMLEHLDSGVNNIVCVQPFGCLPNHIVGKGMMKPLKEKHPEANIAAIDYDASASIVNQQNRLKLMLANARDIMNAEQEIADNTVEVENTVEDSKEPSLV